MHRLIHHHWRILHRIEVLKWAMELVSRHRHNGTGDLLQLTSCGFWEGQLRGGTKNHMSSPAERRQE